LVAAALGEMAIDKHVCRIEPFGKRQPRRPVGVVADNDSLPDLAAHVRAIVASPACRRQAGKIRTLTASF
jgi:hypothetical protein